MRQKQIVRGRFGGALDGEIAKGYLAAAGIDANILKDDGGRMFPSMQQSQSRHLVVAESQKKTDNSSAKICLGEADSDENIMS